MIKLKEPYMVYDDEKDVVHIYDGKAEVACIEHPLINLDYLAQSLGCVIENNVSITRNKEIVKIAPSGICETSEPVAEFDGNHIVWYRFSGEDYKIADVFMDKNGEFTMFDVGDTESKMAEVVYFTNKKFECYFRDYLIDRCVDDENK